MNKKLVTCLMAFMLTTVCICYASSPPKWPPGHYITSGGMSTARGGSEVPTDTFSTPEVKPFMIMAFYQAQIYQVAAPAETVTEVAKAKVVVKNRRQTVMYYIIPEDPERTHTAYKYKWKDIHRKWC